MARSKMSAEHKVALAEGRGEGRVVRAYLEALDAVRPKRGRQRTRAVVEARLDQIVQGARPVDPLRRLQEAQEQVRLQAELAAWDDVVDVGALEAEFVAVAARYADRKRISYAAFREVGVPAAVLKQAGIARTRQQ